MDALLTMSASSVLATNQSSINIQPCELLSSDRGSQHQTISIHSPTITAIPNILTINDRINSITGARNLSHENTNTTISEETVFVGNSLPDTVVYTKTNTIIPKKQLVNSKLGSCEKVITIKTELPNNQNCNIQKSDHIVKIKINSHCDNNLSNFVSTVGLNFEDISSVYNFQTHCISNDNYSNIIYADNNIRDNSTTIANSNSTNIDINTESYTMINEKNNYFNLSDKESILKEFQENVSVNTENKRSRKSMQQHNVLNPLNNSRSSSCCFYYNSPLNMLVISSGQSSPTETHGSITYNDLNSMSISTVKKHSSKTTMIRSKNTTLTCHNYHPSHQCRYKTRNLTNSGIKVNSNDNENNINYDSSDSGEIAMNGIVKLRVSRILEMKTTKQQGINKKNWLKKKNDTICNFSSVSDAVNSNEYFKNCNIIDIKRKYFNSNKSSNMFPITSGTLMLSQILSTPRLQNSEISNMKQFSTSSSNSTSLQVMNENTSENSQHNQESNNNNIIVSIDRLSTDNCSITKYIYEDDQYYKFHINERDEQFKNANDNYKEDIMENDDECFAGYKILNREAIRSAKGTVRGVKNRVRAGIATFLQMPSNKNYKVKDAGKVVIYTTTMGIVRETYNRCVLVKQILKTHMIKYEERDMYMSLELQNELRDRIGCIAIQVPQVFINGQFIGNADTVERLNESGELRLMLKPYKNLDICNICKVCGGYCLLPCPICNGSKKSIHRNDFTTEFIALKCMNCDEVGLVRCQHC